MSVAAHDIVCFSQLRWDFVFQRPHHLMSRAARSRRVWFVEEPVFEPGEPRLVVEPRRPNLQVIRPAVPGGLAPAETDRLLADLLGDFAAELAIVSPIAWLQTPLALPWTSRLDPAVLVYDCMDELTAFRFASPRIAFLEAELLARADIVFTGGASLFEAKRGRHRNVHAFPSAVDVGHFAPARNGLAPAADQGSLPRPRIGWFGVIDERTDLDLLAGIADLRPAWSFVLVGPTVKIDPATVPARPNVHLLGPRPYEALPAYIAGWDVAMMPFARNDSTRFISPTKTLEYLAAGRPVVSTSIRDVVEPYERLGLVRIADEPADFVAAIEAALDDDLVAFRAAADAELAPRSWDETWRRMWTLVERVPASSRASVPAASRPGRLVRSPASAGGRR
jgi:UDP-galactopyranose mutase